MGQHLIDAIADAWETRPTAVLKPMGSPVCGARWLCRSLPGDRAYETPCLANSNTHVVSLVLRSFSGECLVDGRNFFIGKVPTHRLRVLPSGITPVWRSDGTVEIFHLYLPDGWLRQQLATLGLHIEGQEGVLRATRYVADPILLPLMGQLALPDQGHDRVAQSYLESIVGTVTWHLLRHYAAAPRQFAPTQGGEADGIALAVQTIDDHLGTAHTTEQLARTAGLSVAQFNRRFRVATGFTPHQYRLNRRIAEAKLRIVAGGQPMAGIAQELGFADQPHFTRVFRQFTGTTPTAFAASLSGD